jgi:toxin FitB
VNGWLVDTNVVSELRKRTCDPNVEIWAEAQPQETLFLSLISIAEIRFGIARAIDDARRRELTRWLSAELRPWFANRVVGLDEDTMLEWRETADAIRAAGRPIGEPDLLIAASAKRHGLCVVTRNTAEFSRAGVTVFDPWRNVLERPGQKAAKINGLMTLDRV